MQDGQVTILGAISVSPAEIAGVPQEDVILAAMGSRWKARPWMKL